jgi:hypothetical protein
MFGFSPFAASAFSDILSKTNQAIYVDGVQAQAELGTAIADIRVIVYLNGVSAIGFAGTPTTVSGCVVVPTGVVGQGAVTRPLIWGIIDESQTPAWQGINSSQIDVWVPVNDNQPSSWQVVNAGQASTWVPVDDANTSIWTDITT